jgi:asparagine synthase (glutamine-hydrolysing)
LPSTIIDRPKSGMRVPVQAWLNGALRDLANDLLFGKKARERGLFQEKTIRQWLKGEGLIYARQGGKLWLLLTLELWLQEFLD